MRERITQRSGLNRFFDTLSLPERAGRQESRSYLMRMARMALRMASMATPTSAKTASHMDA